MFLFILITLMFLFNVIFLMFLSEKNKHTCSKCREIYPDEGTLKRHQKRTVWKEGEKVKNPCKIPETISDLKRNRGNVHTRNKKQLIEMQEKVEKIIVHDVEGNVMEYAAQFKYLGQEIGYKMSLAKEVNKRIQQGTHAVSSMSKVWADKGLSKGVRRDCFYTIAASVMFYSCETWVLSKEENVKMKTAYYKAMKMISWLWKEAVFNQEGFEEVTIEKLTEELNLPKYEEFMASRRLNFAGTVLGRGEEDVAKEEMLKNKEENGDWFKLLEDDMLKTGITDIDSLVSLKKSGKLDELIKENYDVYILPNS